jgi:hypothetical protein
MKLSELINQLVSLLVLDGDLQVRIDTGDGDSAIRSVRTYPLQNEGSPPVVIINGPGVTWP